MACFEYAKMICIRQGLCYDEFGNSYFLNKGKCDEHIVDVDIDRAKQYFDEIDSRMNLLKQKHVLSLLEKRIL